MCLLPAVRMADRRGLCVLTISSLHVGTGAKTDMIFIRRRTVADRRWQRLRRCQSHCCCHHLTDYLLHHRWPLPRRRRCLAGQLLPAPQAARRLPPLHHPHPRQLNRRPHLAVTQRQRAWAHLVAPSRQYSAAHRPQLLPPLAVSALHVLALLPPLLPTLYGGGTKQKIGTQR